jgi:Holliday junction resolvase RusA-like endonuclease
MKGFVVKTKIGPRAVVTDSKGPELRAFERDIRGLAQREMDRQGLVCSVDQPFEILICYYLPRPNGDFEKASGMVKAGARSTPWVKPDWDKLSRATCDALTGLVWDDDSRVVRAVVEKRFASKERDVGLWLQVKVLPATMRERAEQLLLAV